MGWGKKIRKAVKKVGRTVKKVNKTAVGLGKKSLGMATGGMFGGQSFSGGSARGEAAGQLVTKGVRRQGGSGVVKFNTEVYE